MCHVGGRRRSNSGDQNSGGPSPELAGIALRGTKSGAARLSGTASSRRVRWRGARRRGWPEWSPATSAAGCSSGADEDGDTARFGVKGKARVDLRDALSTKDSAP